MTFLDQYSIVNKIVTITVISVQAYVPWIIENTFPEEALGFHLGNDTWMLPPEVIGWLSVIENVTVLIAPTISEAGVIEEATRNKIR